MGWQVVAKANSLNEGEVLGVVAHGRPIALFKIQGRLYATSNICSHEYALLDGGYVEDDCIECPLHQARFHIPTGAVRSPPASQPIATYPVKIEGDHILVDLPDA
jgi:3-phenylpropionate/trans-cinnamate dioxygenase ferredoxin subunit